MCEPSDLPFGAVYQRMRFMRTYEFFRRGIWTPFQDTSGEAWTHSHWSYITSIGQAAEETSEPRQAKMWWNKPACARKYIFAEIFRGVNLILRTKANVHSKGPTDPLLQLFLPLNGWACWYFRSTGAWLQDESIKPTSAKPRFIIQLVVAKGVVYNGQGLFST